MRQWQRLAFAKPDDASAGLGQNDRVNSAQSFQTIGAPTSSLRTKPIAICFSWMRLYVANMIAPKNMPHRRKSFVLVRRSFKLDPI